MSSILKALKKLESAPVQADVLKTWRGELDLKKVVSRKSRGLHLGRGVVWLVLAVVLLSIGGWLLLSHGRLPGKDSSQPGDQVAVKPVAPPPAAASVPKRTGPQKVPKRSAETPVSEKQKPAPSAPAPPTRSLGQPTLKTKSAAPARPLPPAPANTGNAAAAIIESGEAGFLVQAIAWSETPANRIAVINGQVVHEKDSVDGAIVSEIRLDDVFLKKDGQTWRVIFRR